MSRTIALGWCRLGRAVLVVTLVASAWTGASYAQDSSISDRFRAVTDLRSRGRFDDAVSQLTQIIRDYSSSDDVLRQAYVQLVWTIVAKSQYLKEEAARAEDAGDQARLSELESEQSRLQSQIGEVVGESLTRFPDLVATDAVPDPDRVNQIYEPARQRMFGGLVVDTEPDSAAVWIDFGDGEWQHEGWTPYNRDLFPVGSYGLKVSKEGYSDQARTVLIQPHRTTQNEISLKKVRGKTWWLTRVAAPFAGVAAVLTYVFTSGDDTQPTDQPLPDPPAPPTN